MARPSQVLASASHVSAITASSTTKVTTFMREMVIAPSVHDPDSTKSMFFGVAVKSKSAPLSMIEIRPMDTSRPLTRLLRVN